MAAAGTHSGSTAPLRPCHTLAWASNPVHGAHTRRRPAGRRPWETGARGEVVGPVDDQVVVGHQGQDARLVPGAGRRVCTVVAFRRSGTWRPWPIHLAATHLALTVKDLPLEVGEVDRSSSTMVKCPPGHGGGSREYRRPGHRLDEEHARSPSGAGPPHRHREGVVARVPRALGGRQRRAGEQRRCGSRHTRPPTAVG